MDEIFAIAQRLGKLMKAANVLGFSDTWRKELGQILRQARRAKGLNYRELIALTKKYSRDSHRYTCCTGTGRHVAKVYAIMVPLLIQPGTPQARQLERLVRRLTAAVVKELNTWP